MDFRVDYHIHSKYSDGTKSIAEIIKKYKEAGYDEIAISDHDGIDGVDEAIRLGKDYKIQVISGIELSTVHDGIEMHLLGYKFDTKNEELILKCEQLRKFRHDRNEKLLSTLASLGYELDIDELESQSLGKYVGKPNIARLLIEKGFAASKEEVFNSEKFLNNPEIRKIKKERLDTVEAIRLIANAGGIPVLAHPKKIKNIGTPGSEEFRINFEKLLRELKKEGLKGLEVWYAEHDDEDVAYFGALAGKLHLHMTMGSDYHGEDVEIRYTNI